MTRRLRILGGPVTLLKVLCLCTRDYRSLYTKEIPSTHFGIFVTVLEDLRRSNRNERFVYFVCVMPGIRVCSDLRVLPITCVSFGSTWVFSVVVSLPSLVNFGCLLSREGSSPSLVGVS